MKLAPQPSSLKHPDMLNLEPSEREHRSDKLDMNANVQVR